MRKLDEYRGDGRRKALLQKIQDVVNRPFISFDQKGQRREWEEKAREISSYTAQIDALKEEYFDNPYEVITGART